MGHFVKTGTSLQICILQKWWYCFYVLPAMLILKNELCGKYANVVLFGATLVSIDTDGPL